MRVLVQPRIVDRSAEPSSNVDRRIVIRRLQSSLATARHAARARRSRRAENHFSLSSTNGPGDGGPLVVPRLAALLLVSGAALPGT